MHRVVLLVSLGLYVDLIDYVMSGCNVYIMSCNCELLVLINTLHKSKIFWYFNMGYKRTKMNEQTHKIASIYIRIRKKLEHLKIVNEESMLLFF